MPLLVRCFIKSAFVSLLSALSVGLASAVLSLLERDALSAVLRPVFFHLLVWGWITAMIFGVAFWMFPVYARGNPRDREGYGWAAFWFFLPGLFLRAICEPLAFVFPNSVWKWGLPPAAVFLWLSGLCFVFCIWRRVKGRCRA